MYVSMFPLFPLMNFTAGASLAVFTFKKKNYGGACFLRRHCLPTWPIELCC
jgi:hypothetical protein